MLLTMFAALVEPAFQELMSLYRHEEAAELKCRPVF